MASSVAAQGSRHMGFSNCGKGTQLPCNMCDPPGPGIKSVSSALTGGFVTAAPPGKSLDRSFLKSHKAELKAMCACD